MNVRITGTFNNKWRVLWSESDILCKDFNTNEQAINFAIKLNTNETKQIQTKLKNNWQ